MADSHHIFNFPELKTARVVLRVLTLDHTDAVYCHFSDPDVTQFMDIDPCRCLKDARDIILFHLKDSGCRWGIFDKQTGFLVGTCGYHCWVKGMDSKAEIGFDLAKAYWGQGLMQEALQAAITFGFEAMNLRRIEATIEPDNQRAIGLVKKLGFCREAGLRNGLVCFSLLKENCKGHSAN
jgi:ribosomal-protein-alanine N-acetyltransferase